MPRTKTACSKRKRAEEPMIQPTFLNDRAADTYNSSIVLRKCIPERGVLLSYTNILTQIEARNWQDFTAKPEAAVVPVVREFYANAKEQYRLDKSLTALVRGKTVSYDREAINEFYELEDLEEDEYTAWLETAQNSDEVLHLLTGPDGHWNMTGETIRTLSRSQMTVETKAWHYFICGKMLPSNHYSDATKDRAFLNYAIQVGLSINVGKVIERSIISAFAGRPTAGLSHPSLIYQLCLRAGVPSSAAEEVHHPSPLIDHKFLQTLGEAPRAAPGGEAGTSSSRPARSAAPGAEAGPSFSTPVRRDAPPPPAKTATPPDEATRLTKIERIIHLQTQEQTSLRRELRSVKNRVDQSVEDHRRQFTYLQQALQAIASGSTTDMPSPLQFPVYPPPSPPDSEEEASEEAEEETESAESADSGEDAAED